jgi:signal transduction histidine kinase
MTLEQLLHGFFNFLGTTEGALLKASLEFILFTIVDYMALSEWTRNRKSELKFLIIAFTAMAVDKLFATYFLASFVFTKGSAELWDLHAVHNFFEIFAIFLMVNAFVYPIIKQKGLETRRFLAEKGLALLAAGFVLSLCMLSILDLRGGSLVNFWTDTSVNVAEVAILLYYSYYILSNRRCQLKYRNNIVAAFIIYTITPLIELANILIYDNLNPRLAVASHPFPFLAIMLFTQVVYLKLVDKATIIDRLRTSEKLYAHEKEVSKLKDEFVSTVSHELKTPLTSMKLYVGLLRDGKLGKVDNKQKEALKIVSDEADRLNGLITDILDLSRLESNKAKLNLSEFDLHEIVSSKMYMDLAKRQGISADVEVPRGFSVTADKDKIKQVFINLFNNAVKFTPRGGKITVSAEKLDTEWQLSVADTGRGIDKEKMTRLFEKFYQAEDYMTRTKGGFGLGLAIVKGIVELHKGTIDVESEVGKGTKFTVTIPNLSRY